MIISGEPFRIIADELIKLSCARGARYSNPTPLVSPFWNSTFTPSSTEVYARNLSSHKEEIITTIQPCLRFVDFGHIGDDMHSLFFYMWSCFFPNVDNKFNDYVETIFQILESVTKTNRNSWYATYHPLTSNEAEVRHDFIKVLGEKLLIERGLDGSKCYPIHGTSTYLHKSQNTNVSRLNTTQEPNLNGTPAENIEGPRIELFAKTLDGDLVELATLVLFSGTIILPEIGPVDVPPSLAVAAGIERLLLLLTNKSAIYNIGILNSLYPELLKALPLADAGILFERELRRLVSFVVAESAINLLASDIPDRSNFGPNKEKRRIHREIIRLSSELGISVETIDNIKKQYLDSMIELTNEPA
jgi:alanyl-tRNA synthetase